MPAIVLYELVDGEYRPVSAAAAGTTFVMKDPFEFSIDPAALLDDEVPGGNEVPGGVDGQVTGEA